MKNRLRQERHAQRIARRRRQQILLGVVGIAIVAFITLVVVLQTLNQGTTAATPTINAASTVTSSGLIIEDTVVGAGAEAVIGSTVSVHYTGTLTDGTKFDSSLDRGTPYDVTLGQGRVIQGWEQGIPGMKVGGKRILTIPPELGYGATGSPPTIPANATLIFEVELLAVK